MSRSSLAGLALLFCANYLSFNASRKEGGGGFVRAIFFYKHSKSSNKSTLHSTDPT